MTLAEKLRNEGIQIGKKIGEERGEKRGLCKGLLESGRKFDKMKEFRQEKNGI